MARKIWHTDCDLYSAENLREAVKMAAEIYDDIMEDDFECDPIPDDKSITVSFFEGADGDLLYPDWVDSETDATVELVENGKSRFAKVKAPARLWAKHETGMIASTEF